MPRNNSYSTLSSGDLRRNPLGSKMSHLGPASFTPNDRDALLRAMREARELAIKCGGAESDRSPLHRKCEAISAAIDALAEELTGDGRFFWANPTA
jgi:hypothetical protein